MGLVLVVNFFLCESEVENKTTENYAIIGVVKTYFAIYFLRNRIYVAQTSVPCSIIKQLPRILSYLCVQYVYY